MKPRHIRAFEIKGTRFHVTDRGDGTLQVTSIHPYDETEHHWALQATKSGWRIYRQGRKVSTVGSLTGSEITPEQIAHWLLRADLEAKLTPRTAVW